MFNLSIHPRNETIHSHNNERILIWLVLHIGEIQIILNQT